MGSLASFTWFKDAGIGNTLKIHYLMYLAHGFSLALYDAPILGQDKVRATMYGPLDWELYSELSKYPDLRSYKTWSKEQENVMKQVLEKYGHLIIDSLMNICKFKNPLWKKYWNVEKYPGGFIPDKQIKKQFKKIIKKGKRGERK